MEHYQIRSGGETRQPREENTHTQEWTERSAEEGMYNFSILVIMNIAVMMMSVLVASIYNICSIEDEQTIQKLTSQSCLNGKGF